MDPLQPLDFHALHAGGVTPATAVAASDGGPFAFAHALAHAPLPRHVLGALASRAPGGSPTLDRLARHVEHIERTRVEASRLPERIAEAHANGAQASGIAVAMHRQARLMAAYNLDVLWTAKIVGTAAASLKQLIAAS